MSERGSNGHSGRVGEPIHLLLAPRLQFHRLRHAFDGGLPTQEVFAQLDKVKDRQACETALHEVLAHVVAKGMAINWFPALDKVAQEGGEDLEMLLQSDEVNAAVDTSITLDPAGFLRPPHPEEV